MKILYIGDKLIGNPKDGGDAVKKRNRDMLKQICEHVDVIEIPKINYFKHILNVLTFRNYGHTRALWKRIRIAVQNDYDFIFIDGSSNGEYVNKLNKLRQKTIVFCHNVEYEYYRTKYASHKNLLNFVLMWYVKYNEKLTVQNADRLVTLNQRDDDGFEKYYGRKGDYRLPITFGRNINDREINNIIGTYLLFVGSNFCSNNEGIKWFIENVSPHINIETHVVGSCCSAVKDIVNLKNYPNVKLLGFVEDLDIEYRGAAGVICPIFTGSGMKTKTIEALSYGKTIIGTTEAFVGVDGDYDKLGGLCNTADEFEKVINKMNKKTLNDYSVKLFNIYYFEDVVYPRFKHFLESI